MARKIYKRIGIRRDKNLADLSSTKEGLNSLLDTLIDETGNTFISEDLDVIRNLYAEGMDSDQYQKIIGSRTQKTTSTGSLTDLLPPVTYQNKLDKFQFFAGEPRLNGGNGLTAKYYNQENINIGTTNIFSGTPFDTDNFWEAGNFNYTGKITPLANNSNGGIEWEGFFIPTRTGPHGFSYSTTASFTFEFEDVAESGTLTERMRVGTNHVISNDYSGQVAFGATFTASASGSGNEITLATPANAKSIGIGMSVSGPNIVKDTKVHSVGQSNGVIELRHPDVTEPDAGTPAVTGAISSQSLTFYRNTGVEVNKSYNTPTLIAYQKYRIRIRYFIPRYQGPGGTFIAIDSSGLDRNADINFTPPGSTSTSLQFYHLYDINYDFSDSAKGTFPKFVDNSILFGGGTIGSSSNSNDYVKIKSTKKIDVKYIPPTSLSAITKASKTANLTNGSTVISGFDGGNTTSGIEIGNYVFGTNIPANARVIDIVINQFVILDKNATGGGSQSLTFIDHRGFVKKVTGSTSSNTLTISNGDTTNLKTDMIVIGNGIAQYTGITTTGSSTQVNIFPSQGLGNRSFYFYQGKGLINDSLLQFCQPSIAQCLLVDGAVTAGNTVITVTSIPSGTNGWTVRGFQFADDTTITINTPSTNQITLSKPTINDLVNGEKISIAPASNGDRTLCCPPVDTSPPFTPTEDGLETTSSFPNLKIVSGNVKFDNLTVIKNITVEPYTTSDVSSKYLDINTPSGNFKILCE